MRWELLRHALADPLSAAGLKLELLERRLARGLPDEPALADRVRGAKADLAVAGRLIDLLPRLAGIAGETPSETSIDELCRRGGSPARGGRGSPAAPLLLRRLAAIDALRTLSRVLLRRSSPAGAPPRVRVETSPGARVPPDRGPGHARREPRAALPPAPRRGARPRSSSSPAPASNPTGGACELARREGRARRASLVAPAGAGGERGRPGMKVLVVEDEIGAREALVELVKELGYEVSAAASVAEAGEALDLVAPDVCITDLGLPDGDGLDVVRAAKAAGRDCAVLVLTGKGSVRSAVEAMKAGAHDYLLKPLKAAQLTTALAQLSEQHEAARGVLPAALPDPAAAGGLAGMVGRSAPMLEVFRLLTRVARSNAPVMITGESGTGKEVAAATVHLLSRRAAQPFVALNCGAISPMLVESELFGHERGAFTGADTAPGGDVRDGPRRDALPRRGVGDAPGSAGEVPARPRDPHLPAGRRDRGAGHGHPARDELQPGPRRRGPP